MIKKIPVISLIAAASMLAQVEGYKPVTQQMLENPSPDDWLMFSRTYDAQRFSPLKEINKQNVAKLRMVWTRGMGAGETETIPVVHNGVMYLIAPGAIVQALDATNGDLLWEYKRKVAANVAGQARPKALAIYQDVILYTAPDARRRGSTRAPAKCAGMPGTDGRGNTSGGIVVEGKMISGGSCAGKRDGCYISAHDALTGKELWKFYTTPGKGEPGDESWGGADLDKRLASTWGLPALTIPSARCSTGASPIPCPISGRCGTTETPTAPPARRRPTSTAIPPWPSIPPPASLPGIISICLVTTGTPTTPTSAPLCTSKLNPDPKYVKWINPAIKPGEERDVAVMIGEAGNIFTLDRATGQFLWAAPFPFDTPNSVLKGSTSKPVRPKSTMIWSSSSPANIT